MVSSNNLASTLVEDDKIDYQLKYKEYLKQPKNKVPFFMEKFRQKIFNIQETDF
jgi:hypothetical protein